MANVYSCESCGTVLIFALTRNHKQMPLDKDPHPEGNVAAYQDELGVWHARVLGKGKEPDAALTEHRYMPHFATCTDPAAHRRRQRDQVRAAIADLHKTQRRGRSRPAEKPVTGYVVQPQQLPLDP
jgi:hypothetical protein